MSRRWIQNPNRCADKYLDGIEDFIEFACTHNPVNINRTWYDDDPYILANMTKQIMYLDDPKAESGWKVVQQMDQGNVHAILELDPTENNVDNIANQRLESSMENDAETL
ncbi:hypothetical protein L3X38_024342 [Prunus dulcis]|uniref:DUF4216 domain-containing protein n=1 Tax=Prunus dulcis TaxID=3755 RepID=A0AAD4Z6E2_PRUDU|nr:hypothetical protein L3X38_024342 [Prunus dulcis]